MFVIVGACFIGIGVLKYLAVNNAANNEDKSSSNFFISALCSIAIAVTNALLAKAIQFFCAFEYFESNTLYQSACSWRIGIGQA